MLASRLATPPARVDAREALGPREETHARDCKVIGTPPQYAPKRHVRRLACARKLAKGRLVAITTEIYASLGKALDKVLRGAAAQTEVTVDMVKVATGCCASDKTVREASHARGVRFRKLREKPVLTADDVVGRRTFAEA